MLNDSVGEPSSCEGIREELGRWLDGEAGPEAAERIETHLRCCERCSSVAAGWRRVGRLLDIGLPGPADDISLVASVQRRIAASWWLQAAAMALLALALGALAGGSAGRTRLPAPAEETVAANSIEEVFGPNSYRGFDDLARDLEREEGGGR